MKFLLIKDTLLIQKKNIFKGLSQLFWNLKLNCIGFYKIKIIKFFKNIKNR